MTQEALEVFLSEVQDPTLLVAVRPYLLIELESDFNRYRAPPPKEEADCIGIKFWVSLSPRCVCGICGSGRRFLAVGVLFFARDVLVAESGYCLRITFDMTYYDCLGSSASSLRVIFLLLRLFAAPSLV